MARAKPGRINPDDQPATMLVIGVFFLFAPIGFLLALLNNWPPGAGVAVAIFGGFISIGWMNAFRHRRYWLFPLVALVPMPFIAGPFIFRPLASLGLMDIGASLDSYLQRLILMICAIACIAIGFTLVVVFIRRNEAISGRWKTELDLGQKIHQRLVQPVLVRTPRIEIVGRSNASTEMGGDLLDLIDHNGRIDLLVGDVSGHGVAAGVVMAMVRGAVRSRLHSNDPGSVGDLMRDLSRIVAGSNAPEMFATMAAVRFRTGDPAVEIALAGHNPVLWWRRGNAALQDIENESLPLGVDVDESYTARTITPHPGDWLVLYTDGLVEVFDRDGRQLGMTGFREIVRDELPRCPHAEDLAERIVARVRDHGPISDDQTIAVIRFVG